MIRSAFCFAAFAVAIQAAGSNAQATPGTEPQPQLPAGAAATQPNDEGAPAPLDPNRMIKRTVTIGNRTIVVDQLAGS